MSEPTREQAHYLNERAMRLISKIMTSTPFAVLQGVWEELDKRDLDAAARALVEKIDAIHASPTTKPCGRWPRIEGCRIAGRTTRANYRRCEQL
ncbi:MAG: hypothetical protein IPO08_24780 [Xanthomonadales bacterium]|nr:hypothetical protein [Xanthomonadales bacterium]